MKIFIFLESFCLTVLLYLTVEHLYVSYEYIVILLIYVCVGV